MIEFLGCWYEFDVRVHCFYCLQVNALIDRPTFMTSFFFRLTSCFFQHLPTVSCAIEKDFLVHYQLGLQLVGSSPRWMVGECLSILASGISPLLFAYFCVFHVWKQEIERENFQLCRMLPFSPKLWCERNAQMRNLFICCLLELVIFHVNHMLVLDVKFLIRICIIMLVVACLTKIYVFVSCCLCTINV